MTTLPGPGILFRGTVKSAIVLFGCARRSRFLLARPEGSDLAFLCHPVDQGWLRLSTGRVNLLDRARVVHEVNEREHARSKILLEIGA